MQHMHFAAPHGATMPHTAPHQPLPQGYTPASVGQECLLVTPCPRTHDGRGCRASRGERLGHTTFPHLQFFTALSRVPPIQSHPHGTRHSWARASAVLLWTRGRGANLAELPWQLGARQDARDAPTVNNNNRLHSRRQQRPRPSSLVAAALVRTCVRSARDRPGDRLRDVG